MLALELDRCADSAIRHATKTFHLVCSYCVVLVQGDCSKAKKDLGWVPEITFQELVKDMMEADIANVDAGNDHL